MAGVQSHAAFVAVEVEKQPALAAFADRTDGAVLATFAALDANHVGAKVGQQHGTVGGRDEAAKIDDANSLEQSCHVRAVSENVVGGRLGRTASRQRLKKTV